MISPSSIPTGAVPFKLKQPLRLMTGGGSIELKYGVKMKVIRFPELSPTRAFTDEVIAIVNKHTGTHDVILGRDFLGAAGIVPNPATSLIQWDDLNCPWLPHDHFHGHNWTSAVRTAMEALAADPYLEYDSFSVQKGSKEILSSKYDQVSTRDAAQQQTHLPQRQRDQLADVLQHFTTLFSGKLGCYPHHKVHLELSENAKPFRCREYPIPHAHREVFKEELERLVKIGVLSRTTASKFLSPTFIVPKKDGRVRWVSDFRKLNSMITRKVYNLPRIQDILKRRSHYRYFTKLDISMQYYTFELDEASKDLCTIATPFGNFRYNRLPMGIKQSPDVAQQIMEDVLRDCPEVEVYIDDIGVFSNTWEEHLASLRKVLKILQDNNFTVNPLKCEWAVQETDWLGYWLTPTGIKPWKKKIDALLALQRPQSVTELRSFIGAVTFYRDMFPRRSHLLSPLTAQVGKRKLNWNDECEKSFKEIKSLLAKEAFLRYPDHNKPFHIYTDASDRQLGSVILQEGKPVAFFSRKLNSAQRNYTTGEKELLSIVETLKEYRTMLFGCRELHVYTDHKNLTFHNLQTQRVLRWRLFLEEYGPIFHYIKGNENTAADAFSRLTFSERQSDHPHGFKGPPEKPSDVLHPSFTEDTSDSPVEGYYSMVTDDPDLCDCFVHLPDQQDVPFQLDYKTIAEAQSRDAALQAEAQSQPMRIQKKLLAPGTEVFCHAQTIGGPWKIYLPTSLLRDTVRWYHLALGHCGISRLADTLRMHFHHPRLQQTCENEVSTCDPCQRLKNVGRGHGETASREASLLPWQDVAVDLIGPWTISVGNKKHTFSALTIIDMVTNLVEVIRIENKSAAHVAMHFENHWLSKYPRPLNVIHDQGGEFIGDDFQHRLRVHGINSKPITAKNPQANSVCERMHQAIGNTLRVLTTLQPPRGHSTAKQLVDTAIADTVYATRCTYSSVLKTTPGGLAFGRDMILNIPLITDLQQLQKRRQALIDQRLIAANTKRFSYDYAIGDKVLKLVYNPGKLEPRAKGPYSITRVHANGTLSIQLAPGVIERINMRRVKPYHE
ncbi:reverse transcriptase RNA-dependent DNA polymerase [Nitzschia inconspicua]|uniref:Reverse transcriptase RNA-dependent DNA polymerase n=2 Tax=Nitzschia inconspicua TaxID=303405 RepID=A0A9K3PFT8_9STRA|nr:reverse transcriptase RNA-dependent DNA polymerase [Nitzschia inconspicua]